jgi:hypothetical protein
MTTDQIGIREQPTPRKKGLKNGNFCNSKPFSS